MNEQYRQGDVLLVRVGAVPKGAKVEQNDSNIVLAYGETTGHSHRISAATAKAYQWQGDRLIEIHKVTDLVHEEHSPIRLEPGIYKLVHQREYTPERVRRVVD
jgi:hypothetical protein